MSDGGLTPADRDQIAAREMELAEAERQLALLTSPPPPIRLARPATVGDGIRQIAHGDEARLIALAEEAAARGRFLKFVPASGAATRMFQAPLALAAANDRKRLRRAPLELAAKHGDAAAAEVLTLIDRLDRFAFASELATAMARSGLSLTSCRTDGDYAPIFAHLLNRVGLDYGSLPKALVTFHREIDGPRSAFDQHLAEAPAYVGDRQRTSRLHFTVAPEHTRRFEARLEAVKARLEAGRRLEVSFSHQEPSTDTLAVDLEGLPARLPDGSLLFRPGGHGALLGNLERAAREHGSTDLAFIKNVDNVHRERTHSTTARWKKLLAGLLLELQAELFAHLERLESGEDGEALASARAFARSRLNLDLGAVHAAEVSGGEEGRAALVAALDRPLRVCGMVENQGEPGGGPFWVASSDGRLSLQIVEGAQIDATDPEQQEALGRSTHFNPVDLVCALRDRHGRPYELAQFVDPAAAILTTKSFGDRPLKALEHPGLWNGAMAGWHTVLVEVPRETFAPVKTVLDLLRPEHQG